MIRLLHGGDTGIHRLAGDNHVMIRQPWLTTMVVFDLTVVALFMNKALAMWHRQSMRIAAWMPGQAHVMLDAPSRAGRSLKISLFIAGAILPLGSLIWAGLLWHGVSQGRKRLPAGGRQGGQAVGGS